MTGRIRARAVASRRLGLPATMSAVIHGSLVVFAILAGRGARVALPPMYRVELIAAPAGARAVGVASETPPSPKAPVTPPKRPESTPKNSVAIKKPPVVRKGADKATPTPDARSARRNEPAPKAGGGQEGGKGADVANIKTEGLEFPEPAYLQNIVRAIALRFQPRNAGALHAEIVFLIRRDGSVFGQQFRLRSGSQAFDFEALGAIEAAGRSNAFGPLPSSWADDVLTVIFTFDPKLIR